MSEKLGLDELEHDADVAADFLEGFLDAADIDGNLNIEVSEKGACISLDEVDEFLIGKNGIVLDALQDLVRNAVQVKSERFSRISVDINNYRSREEDELVESVREAIVEAREKGKAVHLPATNAYKRKLMHDVVSGVSGVSSKSIGEDPRRHVVVFLDND